MAGNLKQGGTAGSLALVYLAIDGLGRGFSLVLTIALLKSKIQRLIVLRRFYDRKIFI